MKGEGNKWLSFSQEDMKMAELALKEKIYNQVCFHSQQCVEKAIKGLIVKSGHAHPQSHKLADLVSAFTMTIFEDLKKDILLLDRFYIPTRYPDALPGMLPEGLPSREDAEEAIKIARIVIERATEEIKKP